ncbi:MAG: HlyD family efflux transporter periplasmic adaptor subunit [Pseudomonadales bacterium]|jgi:HlyD family secretion protein
MSGREGTGSPAPLSEALQDHSAEGAEILYSEPAPLLRRTIYLVGSLVVVAVVWSFIGQADVIVSAPGVLAPEKDVRRVYSPAEGEVDSILVQEGDPVSEGDELARISSRDAVRLAAQARQAELTLSTLLLQQEQFPVTLRLMQQESEQLSRQIDIKQDQLEQRLEFGSEMLRREQLAELRKARDELENARTTLTQARKLLASYEQVEGRGIPKVQVDAARNDVETARRAFEQAQVNLRALESRFIEQSAQRGVDLANLQADLESLRIQLGNQNLKIEQAPRELEIKLDQARAEARAAREVRFQSTAAGNLLVILAPVSGVVTQVTFNQPGDKVQANTPLINIAPESSRKVLKVNILESDRAFLEVGQAVKMKFAAFPYQRHGFVDGTLEYISPTTRPSSPGAPPVYEGHVSLEKESIEARGENWPLRYGMSAVAEVVVRKRRVIDMALDPLRGL